MVVGLRDDQGARRTGEAAGLERLAHDNAVLRAEVDRLVSENQRLQARVRELVARVGGVAARRLATGCAVLEGHPGPQPQAARP
jgi:hypothetical protein